MGYIGGKKIMRETEPRLYEYRIKYNATENTIANDSYHYFMAKNAEEAFDSHIMMLRKKGFKVQNISVERLNPYSGKWEDETFFKKDEG